MNAPRFAQIVMSDMPADQLPLLSTDKGCRKIVKVNYKLTQNDFSLVPVPKWKMKKKLWRADFFFVVKLGPADLRFEIRGRSGLVSSNHESLTVEFEEHNASNGAQEKPWATAPRTALLGRYA